MSPELCAPFPVAAGYLTPDVEKLHVMTTAADKVLQYLEEIHALETSLVSTLTAHIALTPRSEYRDLLERHRYETRTQVQRIEQRLGELGQTSSLLHTVYGTAQAVVGQGVALAMAPLSLVRGTGGEEKLLKNAKDEAASEALEIASYDALVAVAEAIGDEKTAVLAREHRTQEELFLEDLREHIPALALAVIAAEVEDHPHYDPTTTGAADGARAVVDEVRGRVTTARGKAETAAGQATAAAEAAVEDVADAAGEAKRTGGKVRKDVEDTAKAVRRDVEKGTDAVEKDVKSGAKAARGDVEAAVSAEAAGATVELDDEIAIDGYDELTVEQVLPKLKTLSAEELAAIDGYERGGKARKRILDRTAALRTKMVDKELAKL